MHDHYKNLLFLYRFGKVAVSTYAPFKRAIRHCACYGLHTCDFHLLSVCTGNFPTVFRTRIRICTSDGADLESVTNKTFAGIFQPFVAQQVLASLQYSALITNLTRNYDMTMQLSGVNLTAGTSDVAAVRQAARPHAT